MINQGLFHKCLDFYHTKELDRTKAFSASEIEPGFDTIVKDQLKLIAKFYWDIGNYAQSTYPPFLTTLF